MEQLDSFEEDDEEPTDMCKPALYVQFRAVDKDTVPADGNEFILKSRLEDSSLIFPAVHSEVDNPPSKKNEENFLEDLLISWVRYRFLPLANEIKNNKKLFTKKFPPAKTIPLHDEEDCCTFCLGSLISSSIYESVKATPHVAPHLPLLSYVIHLKRQEIFALLTLLYKWLESAGMKEPVARWIFALLAVLTKPISDDEEDLLEDIADDCQKRLKDCGKDKVIPLRLILRITHQHFCVKDYFGEIYTLGDEW